ncbi:MAG: ubiquitin-specific protease ubp2 [Alyxoria varia]|nr:MAG: ubiquitin-specific protease ubp2 [Alyxoria varia]
MTTSRKTAPCLLQELIVYDPRDANPEKDHQSCQHAYFTVAERSVLPEAQHKDSATTGAVWKVSSLCRQCRCHLEIVLTHPGTSPCPNRDYPLHHFVFCGQNSEGDGHTQIFDFKCSSPLCKCEMVVQFRLGSLTSGDVSYLIHPTSLKMRLETVQNREKGRTSLDAVDTLTTFRSYIRDSIDGKIDKRIPTYNKKFMAALGGDSEGLLVRLGFVHEQADDGSGNSFWRLPNLVHSGDDNLRVRLQDVFDELNLLIQDRPEAEKQKYPGLSMFSPPHSTHEIQRCMGALSYDKTTRTGHHLRSKKAQDNWYTILGALPDYADSLISFCYDRQVSNDPNESPKYFQSLKDTANARQSETLEEKAMVLESQGQQSQGTIAAAYRHLDIDTNHLNVVTDEHILSRFNTRFPDVADFEKINLRQSLMTLGHARKSNLLLNAASESMDFLFDTFMKQRYGVSLETFADQPLEVETYEDALAFLSVERSTPDDFVVSNVAVKNGESPGNAHLSRKAVEIIAEKRQSLELMRWLRGSDLPSEDVNLQQAYSLFSITEPSKVEEDQIADTFSVAVTDNPARKDEFRQALTIIAQARSSVSLKRLLSDPELGPSALTSEISLHEPRGLKNIGNTCYLNSLLQYFFTIRGIRDLLTSFEQSKDDTNTGKISKKKVGGVFIHRQKIQRAQEFAVELHGLFDSLVKARDAFVMPKEQLARLTLVNVIGDTNRRRSTLTGMSVKATSPIVSTKQPAIIKEVPNDPIPDDFMNKSKSNAGTADAKEETESSTDRTCNVPQYESAIIAPSSAEPMDMGAATYPSETKAQNVTVDDQHSSDFDLGKTPASSSQPPPVPPRPGDNPSRADYEEFAQQQDVQEVIENVLDQLRWAIKPETVEDDGEQVDAISRLFYGKENYTITSDSAQETKLEPFYYLLVYLNAGPCDLYGAIDAAFDLNSIEDSSGRAQFKTIQSVPPILQFRVPRVGFDAKSQTSFKIDHRLKLYDEIYMDRYMDDEHMLTKRRESWALNEELDVLRADRGVLTSTATDLRVPESLQAMRTYLGEALIDDNDDGDEEKSSVDSMRQWLEEEAGKAHKTLEQVDSKIEELERAKSQLFPNQGLLKYRLHAVFVHRGDSIRGHWFIYINDPEHNVWRQYNDETVTTVMDTKAIFEPDSSLHGTSAFVVYIHDLARNEIIDTVRREPEDPRVWETMPDWNGESDWNTEVDTIDSGRASSGALPDREPWDLRETDDRSVKW